MATWCEVKHRLRAAHHLNTLIIMYKIIYAPFGPCGGTRDFEKFLKRAYSTIWLTIVKSQGMTGE